MFNDDAVGKEAARTFEEYWLGFADVNPQCNTMEWKFAIGMVYFEGFCNGFDFKQNLIQEITLSN